MPLWAVQRRAALNRLHDLRLKWAQRGMTEKVRELSAFLNSLGNLWAILASVSVFFPFSSRFFELIPVESAGGDPSFPFYYLPTPLVPLVATLVCAYVMLSVFNQRDAYLGRQIRPSVTRKSGLCLPYGLGD